MNVKKIFLTLITIVACVLVGAFILNIILPNASATLVNSCEDMIYKASGMSFDFNNDGKVGGANHNNYTGSQKNGSSSGGTSDTTVTGFK